MKHTTTRDKMAQPAGKHRQHIGKNSERETPNRGNSFTDPTATTNAPPPSLPTSKAGDSKLEVYVPPYRLRSPEENAKVSQTMPSGHRSHRKSEAGLNVPRTRSPPPDHGHGGPGTGVGNIFSAQEEEAHVRMLAWENWAFRNILMYRFGLSRQDINLALDVERQRLAAGERSYWEPGRGKGMDGHHTGL